MQILLGAHETIVKINSQGISIDYIQHFISTHFASRTIDNNTINIPASRESIYHRTFLLKWLYSLYTKKSATLPELRESLLRRYHKPIKIILPKKIIHLLKYKIIDNQTAQLSITPQNSAIAYIVKTFLQVNMTILPTHLQINFKSQEERERLKLFLSSKTIIEVPHQHIYDKKRMSEFLNCLKQKESEIKKTTHIDNAYMILGVNPTDTIKSIKKQYKSLAKELHPDTITTNNKELIELHTKKFQALVEAYEIILCTNN